MNISTQSLQTAFEPLVSGRLRAAEESDRVAGVQPQIVVEPEHEEEVAAVLAHADKEGLKVLVRGGGTQLDLGFPPQGGDILLSTTRMKRIIEHMPHDMTLIAQAGLPLTELQTALAQTQQWLALDPPLEPAATIGGLVATNATGPRRLRYGGVRDQIIGIRVVLPDGTIAKGGGKVVKNVAGYDLPKLFTGALGTLGVIVSATFRLYPLPIASRTVILTASTLTPLCELAIQIIGSTLVPTIVDITGSTLQDQYTLAVRFEMSAEAAEAQAITLVKMAKGATQAIAQTLEGEDETRFWLQSAQDAPLAGDADTTLTLKVSLLPTDVAHWLNTLEQYCKQQQLQASWRAGAGHGLITVRLAGKTNALIAAVQTLQQAALEQQGSLVVTKAAPTLTSQLDVWGPSPALEVMRSLKARFDPHNTINPGRFIGGI